MDIEKEISGIKKRNQRVEMDKAWELSWVRRLFVEGYKVTARCQTRLGWPHLAMWLNLGAKGNQPVSKYT